MLQHLPALVTLLNVLLQFATLWVVGNARKRYGVKAPAISGHPGFERAWRIQMNTLEASAMFLPVLWLASMYGFPALAGGFGFLWLIGRAWYIPAYLKDPAKRGTAFGLSLLAWAALVVLSAFGIVRAMVVG
ncbi:MAPEG family protein [Dyella sp. GSA-30]|uniref:MAPEG family protein n=1 Tax=Dyella sp. GSA-30 TaxID=2994496 RepID=UPI003093726D|nr:membrane protein [Dyella sp. GSA-30]